MADNEKEIKEQVTKEDFTKLVDSFKEVAARPIHVTVDPPKPATPVEDPRRRQEELAAKYKDVKTQANELAQNGDAAGAFELLSGFIQEQAASVPQQDLTKHPAVKSVITLGERLAKQQYKDEFDKYGDEIREYFESLPSEKKMSVDAWDEVIGTIRTRHFDDYLEDARQKEREALQQSIAGGPPSAPGSRGRRISSGEGEEVHLTEEEVGVAKSFGMSDEEYAKQRKTIESTRRRDYFPLLDDDIDERDRRIEPGKF